MYTYYKIQVGTLPTSLWTSGGVYSLWCGGAEYLATGRLMSIVLRSSGASCQLLDISVGMPNGKPLRKTVRAKPLNGLMSCSEEWQPASRKIDPHQCKDESFNWGYDVCLDLGRLAWDALFSPNNFFYRPFQTNFTETSFLLVHLVCKQLSNYMASSSAKTTTCKEWRSYSLILWYLVHSPGIRLPKGMVHVIVNWCTKVRNSRGH